MMNEITWKIYYSDGSTFSNNEDNLPPARDVQVIVEKNRNLGWITQSGYDYYVYKSGSWVGVDQFGLYDFLLDSGLVLFGRTISNEEFDKIFGKANEDRQFALKVGFLPKERSSNG